MSTRQKMTITPSEGLSVPKPDGGSLDAKGEQLPVTPYWRRRERDGDVTISERAKPAARKRKPRARKPKAKPAPKPDATGSSATES